ncbi:MAG: putative Ig domain-containing protein, partial [Candidatus Omnitrophota bacterium]
MKLLAIIISFWSFILSSSSAFAADYYVDDAQANNGGDGLSWATAKKHINAGVSAMSGGDTLYIRDGVYTGDSNRIRNVPSGSAGNYTRIYAENDWGVTISNPTDFPAYLNNSSYIEVRGVKFKDYTSLKVYVNSSNHIKIIRCSSDDNGGSSAGFLASNSSYVLFEECYKYGASRYAFQVSAGGGSSSYIIFRRCVVRWDYSDTIEPQACFANYDQSYVYFQNCIAIDGLDIRSQEVTYDGTKGFFTPNGANQTHFQGCIALNLEGAGYWIEDSPVVNVTLTNSVAWDCKNHANTATDGYPPRSFYSRPGSGPLTLNHCVFGQSNWTSRVVDSDLGAGDTLKNSIIANFSAMTDYAEDGFDTSIYNDYYGNSGGRNRNGGLGANSLTTNPFTNSLKYLTRIESGSDLSGQADDGGDIGATILKKIGVSGALYGEAGWDTVTSDNLWPFPNEDILRADMKAWSKAAGSAYAGSPAMSGDRGFCADGTTLTKYIWEYLGNVMPVEIYNAPVLDVIGNKSVDENVNLDFTISATDVNGDTLTYSASGLPAGASFNTASRRFSWTPDYSQAGSYDVTFSANDGTGDGGTDSETITITVNNVNRAPVLAAIGNKLVDENVNLAFTLSASDEDGDSLSYSAVDLPSGAAFNNTTGAFSWTPDNSQVGNHSVTFYVNDGNVSDSSDSETITVTVNRINRAPVLA